jgi:hypothetical protein
MVVEPMSSWKNNLQIQYHFTDFNRVYFYKSNWKRDGLKQKTQHKVGFHLNRRNKTTTGARHMGFDPAHSEIHWLFV